MAVTTTNLGVITAYGDAVAAGYTGTKAEWQALMASYATVGQQAVDAKNAAVAAKDTAVSKATEATTAATTATTKASEASASAESIAQSASQIQENTDDITQLKSELNNFILSITGTTENVFDISKITEASGWTIENNIASGTAGALYTTFGNANNGIYTFDGTVTEFVLTMDVYVEANADTVGLIVKCNYTDGTSAGVNVKNNTTDWTTITLTSKTNNTTPLKSITFDYSSGRDNVWHIKNAQLILNTTTSPEQFIQHLTAADSVAREGVETANQSIAYLSSRIDQIDGVGFGIKINTDGTTERIGGAVGKHNDYVVGSNFAGQGINDFDNIYPWSEIKLCNIKYDLLGDPIITYEGEQGFNRDGTNGDVLVEIPVFYTKRYTDSNGSDCILISGKQLDGYEREPAFYDSETGEPINAVYVGAYFTQTGVNVLNSKTGVFPESNISKTDLLERSGEMYDFVTLQMLQKLIIIEFGSVDLSDVFGGFSNLPWSSSCRAAENKAGTNSGYFKGSNTIANIGVGNTISIATTNGQIQNRTITAISDVIQSGGTYYRTITFDGDPVDLVDDTTWMYCTGQKTGFSDSLNYHTGRTNLNSGSTLSNQFRYRWIEGLWGTLGEILNCVFVKDLRLYFTNNKEDPHNKYKRLNFAIPLQNTYTSSANPIPPQIKHMGMDFRHKTIIIPDELTEITDHYYGDLLFTIETVGPDGQSYPEGTEFIGISSMAWDGNKNNGLFTIRFWNTAEDVASMLYGTRMIIRHF